MTGRTQAFSLGESFAENYAFTLLNESHKYKIEYGGKSLNWALLKEIKIEFGRQRIGSHKDFGG